MATIEHPVCLRPGDSSDLDAVMKVMTEAFGDRYGEAWTRSQCAGILPMLGVSLVVAREGENIVGFSLSRSVADESELLLLAVLPSRHREGIGGLLLDNFVERSRSAGVTRVHLEVRDGNPAIEMYRTAGFRPVGRRRNYYHAPDGRRFDALTFAQDVFS
ncbi:ribosomal protein S18-alanine N-acetyltransferase [Sphingomonas limnosediminicola]|jgi:ribosomal-protein-alanine N-acetyltransferase|uniref:Ribosomal protein S18-alanine N-acetyltransferase n=1 Tax=Sphingomonas limnosediminicola TaxID=940133 RepID=A0ABP7L3E9_9SPHN